MPVVIADVGFTLNFDSVEEIKFVIRMLQKGIVEIEKAGEEPPYQVGFYFQDNEPAQPSIDTSDPFPLPSDDKKRWN